MSLNEILLWGLLAFSLWLIACFVVLTFLVNASSEDGDDPDDPKM